MNELHSPTFSDLWAYFDNAPRLQLVFIVLFFLVPIIGGNGLFIAHSRRMGRPWEPFRNPFRALLEFNALEWALLAGVYVVSGVFALLAVLAG